MSRAAQFEECILPHLAVAYNLARWMMSNGQDAEDVVQEAFLRAFRSFDTFRGVNGRPWLLAIVRNTCYSSMRASRVHGLEAAFDEKLHSPAAEAANDPELRLIELAGKEALQRAIDELPAEFREAIVLRELEELSYKEISEITGVPMGTVMSRLARARSRLQKSLTEQADKEHARGL